MGILPWLFDLHVVPRKNLRGTVGDEDRRCIAAGVQHNPFAQHFTRQIFPFIPRRCASKAVNLIRIALALPDCFNPLALITENAYVVADLYALRRAQIHVRRHPLPLTLLECRRTHDRSHRLSAYRGEMVEGAKLFIRRRRTLFERPHNISALHEFARKDHFRHRSFWLYVYYPQMSKILIQNAHGLCDLRLSFEPIDAIGIFGFAHDHEAVADSYAICAAAIDVHVLALRKDDPITGLFAGDEVEIPR